MITVNTPQTLGRKVFLFFLWKRILIAIIVIIIALVLAVIGNSLISGIAGVMSTGGTISHSSLVAIARFVSNGIFALFCLGLVVGMIGFVIGILEYRNYTFTLDEFDFKVTRGIFSIKEISIPYRQIQDVAIERSFSYRLIGLARLILSTAGHEEKEEQGLNEVALEPIDFGLANELREILERKVGVQVIESEKEADTDRSALPTH